MEQITDFKKYGYCIVKNALPPAIVNFVTQYALFFEMQNQDSVIGDSQVSNSLSVYGDPAMETVLLMLHPILEKYTGIDLYPTYSYYRIYRNGSYLKKHTDRDACEISATLCFNYNFKDKNFSWPIFIDGNPVYLESGDIAIYRGCDLEHWREKLVVSEEEWLIQGFFHFVDKHGPNTEWKYDKRHSVGDQQIKSQLTQKNKDSINKSYIEYVK